MSATTLGVILAAVATFGILYPHVLYPMLLVVLGRFAHRPLSSDHERTEWPRLTVLIAAYNEDDVIERCVRSVLDGGYPADQLRVIVGDDGSTDRTATLLAAIADNDGRITVRRFERQGKNAVLARLIAETTTDVVAFTDADCRLAPDALLRLTRWFDDDGIGGVIGQTVRSFDTRADAASGGEAAQRGLDATMNAIESRLASTVTSNGHLYAVRRSMLSAPPNARVADDFYIPLSIVRRGGRVIVDNEAHVVEDRPNTLAIEIRRTIRTSSASIATVAALAALLLPSAGWTSWFLWSHRIFRWLSPFFVLLYIPATICCLETPWLFGLLFYGQLAVYALAFVGYAAERMGSRVPVLPLITFFIAMNLSLLLGWWRVITTRALDHWSPSRGGL